MRNWKACERCIAELLGGHRVPVSGRGRGDVPDALHSRLSIEVSAADGYQIGWRMLFGRRRLPRRTGSYPLRGFIRIADRTRRAWSSYRSKASRTLCSRRRPKKEGMSVEGPMQRD